MAAIATSCQELAIVLGRMPVGTWPATWMGFARRAFYIFVQDLEMPQDRGRRELRKASKLPQSFIPDLAVQVRYKQRDHCDQNAR